MIKNGSGQYISAGMHSATDGSDFTSTVTVYVTGNNGTRAIGSVGSGVCTHEGAGLHSYNPSQAETNYDYVAYQFSGTGAVTEYRDVYPRALAPDVNVTAMAAGVLTAAAIASDAITAAKIANDAITAAKIADGAIDAATFAASAINAAAIATDAFTAAKVAADVTTELQSGLATAAALTTVDSGVTTLLSRLSAVIADKLGAQAPAILKAVIGGGSTTTAIVLNATTGIDAGAPSSVDNYYNGRVIIFTSGALAGQATDITDYDGTTKTLTVTALTGAPASAVTAIIA